MCVLSRELLLDEFYFVYSQHLIAEPLLIGLSSFFKNRTMLCAIMRIFARF